MKKLAIFAAAFVLTLGLAQCKKEQPNAQNLEGKTVHLTVNVGASAGSATNGSRADIPYPSTGQYDFKDGDKLYVGYNNAYVGTLDYSTSANKFSGDITISQSGSQRLHFYYLGGGTANQVGETQQYTVDISDQSENYPVISYGTSNVDYTGGGTYSTTLLNQCALVEFITNEIPTTTAVSISGMKNKVTVDFNGNTLTPSSEGTGSIKLHAESATSRWAILLANEEEVESTASAEGYDATGITIPAINNNDHWTQTNGKNINFTMTAATTITVTPSQIGNISDGGETTINNTITIATRYGEDGGGSGFVEYNGVGDMDFGDVGFAFSSSERKISKIEVNYTGEVESWGSPYVNPNPGWQVENSAGKFTLSGYPTDIVEWHYYFGLIYGVQSIVFTLSND